MKAKKALTIARHRITGGSRGRGRKTEQKGASCRSTARLRLWRGDGRSEGGQRSGLATSHKPWGVELGVWVALLAPAGSAINRGD